MKNKKAQGVGMLLRILIIVILFAIIGAGIIFLLKRYGLM